ncbi:MAG: hypothetical protein WC166_03395, partial [Bacteroidales bacterium]
TLYYIFDKRKLIAFFGDYKTMLLAINSNTGGEYDIKNEEYSPWSDIHYQQMINAVQKIYPEMLPNHIVTLPNKSKLKLAHTLRYKTDAGDKYIKRFLRCQ